MQNQQANSLFDGVPGPTPWYVRTGASTIRGFEWRQTNGRAWKDATESYHTRGKLLLIGNAGCVAVFDFYNWIMPLDDSTLLAWNQTETRSSVRRVVFRPSLLPPFNSDLEEIEREIAAQGRGFELSGPPLASFTLSTTTIDQDVAADFPQELHHVKEILILCHSPVVEDIPGMKVDLALLVAKPSQGVFRLYPQDWFNAADLDFGYQWVTRVARNPQTGRVHGEGFRLKPFELDDSLRQLAPGTQPQSDFFRGE